MPEDQEYIFVQIVFGTHRKQAKIAMSCYGDIWASSQMKFLITRESLFHYETVVRQPFALAVRAVSRVFLR